MENKCEKSSPTEKPTVSRFSVSTIESCISLFLCVLRTHGTFPSPKSSSLAGDVVTASESESLTILT